MRITEATNQAQSAESAISENFKPLRSEIIIARDYVATAKCFINSISLGLK